MAHVFLLGSGGREHAFAWKLAQSPDVTTLTVIPGSDGIASVEKSTCLAANPNDPAAMVTLAQAQKPDLIIIGPEAPLAAGVSDALRAAGFAVAAPSQAAAQLESSKIFAKNFMAAQKIPTASFTVCHDFESARTALTAWPVEENGIVIKADGLSAGKGVVVTLDRAEAEKTLHDFMQNPQCSVKTDKILFEEVLTGKEVSAFALCDGTDFIPLGYACDYKRVGDNNIGPNTGGMGGYAPQGWPTAALRDFVNLHVFKPVVDGMAAAGTPFTGILFAGLMVDGEKLHVIEFNTRFGDPEAQILLPLIDNDLYPLFLAASHGTLSHMPPVTQKTGTALHVVMVSGGYPETMGTGMQLGQRMEMPEDLLHTGTNDNSLLFIAGAQKKSGAWQNTSGRVLGVTALGETLEEARKKAYDSISRIHFDGAHWRTDIGT